MKTVRKIIPPTTVATMQNRYLYVNSNSFMQQRLKTVVVSNFKNHNMHSQP
jgi:hypothetical protein